MIWHCPRDGTELDDCGTFFWCAHEQECISPAEVAMGAES